MKKVLAIILAVVSVFNCFGLLVGAEETTSNEYLKIVQYDDTIVVDVIVKDATGISYFCENIDYDPLILKMDNVTEGLYKSQYEGCGEAVDMQCITPAFESIRSEITISNGIYDDETFSDMFTLNNIKGTPVSSNDLVLFTVNFSVRDGDGTSTAIKLNDVAYEIQIQRDNSSDAEVFLDYSIKNNKVILNVGVENAVGLKEFGEEVKYDSSILAVSGEVKDGEYKSQYEECGEHILTTYNTNISGTIIPGIVIANEIYDDATFAAMCEDNKVEATPVSTDNLTLFTIKFTIITTDVAKTTITCGGASTDIDFSSIDIDFSCYPQCRYENLFVVREEITHYQTNCCDPEVRSITCKCLICGKEETSTQYYYNYDDLSLHRWTGVTYTQAPTCTARGYDYSNCDYCGMPIELNYTEMIPHAIVLANVKTATHESAGYTGDSYCLVCHQLLEKGKEIPMLQKEETTVEEEKTTSESEETISTEETIVPNVEEEKATFSIKDYIEKIISKIREFFKKLF